MSETNAFAGRVVKQRRSGEELRGVGREMLTSIHRKDHHSSAISRVWIAKYGKKEKRPLGIPVVADLALQRHTAEILTTIYEQDFLKDSFGGRPGRGQHNALATLNQIKAGEKVGGVFEAD
ncbi:hypothetical protein [Paenibacillus humicus]|uniref:hypothetical protein n=1 Tax=Paenibacillus humicus TaxID=412861 RepID=UPI003F5CC799